MSSIEFKNLKIGYHAGGNHRVVAEGLNGSLEPGTLTCFVGANGAGKSTLMRTLAGFVAPLGGEIRLGGRDLRSLSAAELSRQVAVVLTERPQLENMTVEEIVGLGRAPYTGFWGGLGKEDREHVERALALVGIEALRRRRVATLSDGECQKAMIAKALAQDAPLILLDEPTAFLDFPGKVETLRLLSRLCGEQGKTILVSIHDLDLALRLAGNLWVLASGELHAGRPAELIADGTLERAFAHRGIAFTPRGIEIE